VDGRAKELDPRSGDWPVFAWGETPAGSRVVAECCGSGTRSQADCGVAAVRPPSLRLGRPCVPCGSVLARDGRRSVCRSESRVSSLPLTPKVQASRGVAMNEGAGSEKTTPAHRCVRPKALSSAVRIGELVGRVKIWAMISAASASRQCSTSSRRRRASFSAHVQKRRPWPRYSR
jgi:hypothetical protein